MDYPQKKKMKNDYKNRIEDLIFSYSNENSHNKIINNLKNEAIKLNVPIIRNEISDILSTIIKIQKPQNILELGTGIGYSTLIMLFSNNASNIITVENY